MHRQLDIFDDSRDVALRNDLAEALLDGDPAARRRIADTLQAKFGADPVLAAAAALIEHYHWRRSVPQSHRPHPVSGRSSMSAQECDGAGQ